MIIVERRINDNAKRTKLKRNTPSNIQDITITKPATATSI